MSHSRDQSAVIPVEIPGFYTALYRDFIAGTAEASIPSSFRDPESWRSVAEGALSACSATERFWSEVESFNRRMGASESAVSNIGQLRARKSVAVVAGQQPGLLGGPLLVMYKAATSLALSDYVAEVTGIPCSPVFIVASDDSDLAEIARCTFYDVMFRRLDLEFSGDGYTAGRMVGGLSVEEENQLARSLIEALGDSPGLEDVSALLQGAGSGARDHGEFVAGLLSSVFSRDGLVVVDGRDPAMREAGASLFNAYISKSDELKNAVASAGDEMVRMGYHAQIAGASLDSWLFVLDGEVRKKVSAASRDDLKRIVGERPESLSPNVALRPIWREATLPTVCCVCGPSEVAYSLQLKEAYKILGVRMPVLFPRLSLTLVPREGEQLAGGWHEAALEGLLTDFTRVQARHYRSLIPEAAAEALAGARASLDQNIAELSGALERHSDKWGKAADSVRRAAARELDRLERSIVDGLKRDGQRENPRLRGVGDFLLPEGRLQERTLSFLYPLAQYGIDFGRHAISLARSHVEESASGRVRHYCHRLEDRPEVVRDA